MAGKKRKKAVKTEVEEVVGEQPDFDATPLTESELRYAYRWYGYDRTSDQHASSLNRWVKMNRPELQSSVRNITLSALPQVVCLQAQMMIDGAVLPITSVEYFEHHLAKAVEKAAPSFVRLVKSKGHRPTVQENMREKIGDVIAQFEDQIDQFQENGYESDFEPYAWLKEHDIKGKLTKPVAKFYEMWYQELLDVKAKTDKDLIEGYSHIKASELKKLTVFIKAIISDCTQLSKNAAKSRKQRVTKTRKKSDPVKLLKYLKDFDELKLVSVDPIKIIGAQQVWIYNTARRKITVYNAEGPGGLQVSRSSIRSFDPETSITKSLRSPDKTLPHILTAGKVPLRKIMVDIKAKASDNSGQVNDKCIILRVIK